MMFILVPTLDEAGVAAEIEIVKGAITAQDGEITAEKAWGRRRMAYPIRDFSDGVYHILRFSLKDSTGLKELARFFRLSETVLRHLVIRDEGTPLEYAPQSSESEDYRDRDRSDHRRGGGSHRDRPRRDSEDSGGRTPVGAGEDARG
jgi:small subunit ribosomal protein S6